MHAFYTGTHTPNKIETIITEINKNISNNNIIIGSVKVKNIFNLILTILVLNKL